MIPTPQKWRKQVMLSMSAGALADLKELAKQDHAKWGGKVNRSRTVAELIAAEKKRRAAK
jgi:hypothetical protein